MKIYISGKISGTDLTETRKRFAADLLQCKAIYMLQGWKDSKGARIEHYIATEIGIPITYEIERD